MSGQRFIKVLKFVVFRFSGNLVSHVALLTGFTDTICSADPK